MSLKLFLLLLLQLYNIFSIFPPVSFGHFIYDLYGGDSTDFQTLASQWTVVSQDVNATQRVSNCNLLILGGFGILNSYGYLERTYSSLPSHTIIYYAFRFYMIDEWQPLDYFLLRFDDEVPTEFGPSYNYGNKSYCGGNGNDYDTFMVGKALHNESSVKIRFEYQFNPSGLLLTSSFGIRDVYLLFTSQKAADAKESLVVQTGVFKPHGYGCPFNFSEDQTPNQCTNCSPNCYLCFGQSDNECYYYKPQKYCLGGTCTDCPANCHYCSEQQKCSLCIQNYALFWDYSCRLNTLCSSPHRLEGQGARKECKTPCQLDDKYMLWNGTCTSQCLSPLQSVTEGQAMFCNYPCNNTLGEYLYWNGSCLSQCNGIPRDENGYKFCDTCPSESFLYPDGRCLSVCPSIFRRRYQGSSQFCEYSCKSTSSYYYPEIRVCKTACEYPYKIESFVLCLEDLSEAELKELQKISGITNGMSLAMSIVSSFGSFVDFKSADAAFSVTLVKMLWYIRYINIKYPMKLQKILDWLQMESGLIRIIPEVPQEWRTSATKQLLPEKFEQYNHHSSFLINFWQSFVVLVVASMAIVFVSILYYSTRKAKSIHSVCKKAKDALQWNIFLSLYLTCYDSMILYSSFELLTVDLESGLAVFSFLVCVLMNILALAVLVVTIQAIFSYRSSNQRDHRPNSSRQRLSSKSKWQHFEILFTYYKGGSFLQQTFVPLFIIRATILNLIISYLYEYPLAQAISITLLSLLMILYLGIKLPLKQKTRQIHWLVQETVLLIVNICILILAVFDNSNMEYYQARENIGSVIIGCNIAFSILSSSFIVLQIVIHGWSVYRHWRKSRTTLSQQQQQQQQAQSQVEVSEVVLNGQTNTSLGLTNATRSTSRIRKRNTKSRTSNFDISFTESQIDISTGNIDEGAETTAASKKEKAANFESFRRRRRENSEHFNLRKESGAEMLKPGRSTSEDLDLIEGPSSMQNIRNYRTANLGSQDSKIKRRMSRNNNKFSGN